MDDFLYGLILGAVCVAVASFLHGFVSEWRKDVGRRDYEEFKRIQAEFDRQYSNWVGLTDAELAEFSDMKLGAYDLCLEVEAKLKEKNA